MEKHSRPSISESNGIGILAENDKKIYSVGISTGGAAEIRMAMGHPSRFIIATTIDHAGADFAQHEIAKRELSKQIEVKIENVTEPLPYPDGFFDYVYARLVLHYLPKKDLQCALQELYRILRSGGKLFIVVRSIDCVEAQHKNSVFDPETHLTTYYSNGNTYSRYFHSEASIKHHIQLQGFSVQHLCSYQEQLCIDFQRSIPANHIDTLIEVLATK